jgi:tetratricopeptide (TPR) repeat protein
MLLRTSLFVILCAFVALTISIAYPAGKAQTVKAPPEPSDPVWWLSRVDEMLNDVEDDPCGDKDEIIGDLVASKIRAGMFAEAANSARQLDGFDRAWTLCQVAVGEAEAGLYADAWDLRKEIERDLFKVRIAIAIAKSQAAHGKRDDAVKTFAGALDEANIEPNDDDKSTMLSEIAEAQASAGFFDDAMKTAKGLQSNAHILRHIALLHASAGRIKQALAVADEIKVVDAESNSMKMACLLGIAEKQQETGDHKGAVKTYDAAKALVPPNADGSMPAAGSWDIIDTATRLGLFGEAKDIVRRIQCEDGEPIDGKIRALSEIAAAEASAGKNTDARQTILDALAYSRKVQDKDREYMLQDSFTQLLGVMVIAEVDDETWDRARAIMADVVSDDVVNRFIVEKTIRRGDIDQALATAKKIKDGKNAIEAYCVIAEAQFQRGDKKGAGDALDAAIKVFKDGEGACDCDDWVLRGIVDTCARVGMVGKALDAWKEISLMGCYIEDVGEAIGKTGRADEAQKILELMRDESPDVRAKFCIGVARALLDRKEQARISAELLSH